MGTAADSSVWYRWSCPYCNASRTPHGELSEQKVHARAKSAVTGHVSSSMGGGHGPRHRLPPDFDAEYHIERVVE